LNPTQNEQPKSGLRSLPRNVWAVSLTSFLMDASSEMVLHLLPLFLSNVLGVGTAVIGVIEGLAETTSSLLKVFSGWLSDRLRARKWVAVVGYLISAISKPLFYFPNAWTAGIGRSADRLGKGVRTAPRDALVADSIDERNRGLAFGFHRAADTGGAVLGVTIALIVVWLTERADKTAAITITLENAFPLIVLISLIPAALAVISLALGANDVPVKGQRDRPRITFKGLGKPFLTLMLIVGVFTLGNSSDAFLILRAQNAGLSLTGILGMLITFNLVYAALSTPAGSLSDRIGRRRLIVGGWLVYAAIYIGFALAGAGWQVWLLYALYGVYYGLAEGTAKALVADIVPADLRGTAYGTYNAMVGLLALPASVIAGLLWQGFGSQPVLGISWAGFGPAAPFLFGGGLALAAAVLMALWKPGSGER
jgi:MFS family permease